MDKLKTASLWILLVIGQVCGAQSDPTAKALLDEVSKTMGAYDNMYLRFSSYLVNEEAGIKKGDEPEQKGKVTLQKEKYYLEYLENIFIFDGAKLYRINDAEKEVTITEGDIEDDDLMLYPSKLLTFYKEGYNYKMGKLKNVKGRMIQYVSLFPIDSDSEIKEVEICVDKRTKHIYQLIQHGIDGVVTTLTVNEFKSNQELSPTLFTFDRKKYELLEYIID